jgi:hypothetical protein
MNQFRAGMLILMISILSHSVSAQTPVSASTTKELEEAESKAFMGILHHNADYFKDYVADDYITINADGIMADKEQTYADSSRYKILNDFTWKLSDKKIRAYGDVGIITGRARIYMKDSFAAEYLYTAIFVKDHQKWMFTGWQGTMSKDSPKPPSIPTK